MQQNYLNIKDISKKQIQNFESRASGILILSQQNFDEFLANPQRDSILQTAIITGISAAKKTSEIFPLCYQIPLHAIHIDIIPSQDIVLSQVFYHTGFIQSFKPKKFSWHTPDIKQVQSESTQIESTWLQSQKQRFDKAKKLFEEMQKSRLQHNKSQKKRHSEHNQCGFQVYVNIKAQSRVPTDMESLNAVSATLLSLFNIFKPNDKNMVIAQIRLEEHTHIDI